MPTSSDSTPVSAPNRQKDSTGKTEIDYCKVRAAFATFFSDDARADRSDGLGGASLAATGRF
jgi:hypothetical protein